MSDELPELGSILHVKPYAPEEEARRHAEFRKTFLTDEITERVLSEIMLLGHGLGRRPRFPYH